MAKDKIAIDIGYGQTKIKYKDKIVKFPTSIALFTDTGIEYGDTSVYDFEGEKYLVGSDNTLNESFSTMSFEFIYKFAPLIIYHILKKFDLAGKPMPLQINTGLALVDWTKENVQKFKERLSEFEVNNDKIQLITNLVPQGIGIFMNYNANHKDENLAKQNVVVIDIGYNTINLLHINKGKFQRPTSKSYPGHGVSSLIKPFRAYLENKFKTSFTDQEAMQYAIEEKMFWNGIEQKEIEKYIKDEKRKFVLKLFKSVLQDELPLLGRAHKVLISGGGSYLLQNAKLPPHYVVDDEPMEFSNVKGYYLL
jgi:plasmid segregation protein ParM